MGTFRVCLFDAMIISCDARFVNDGVLMVPNEAGEARNKAEAHPFTVAVHREQFLSVVDRISRRFGLLRRLSSSLHSIAQNITTPQITASERS